MISRAKKVRFWGRNAYRPTPVSQLDTLKRLCQQCVDETDTMAVRQAVEQLCAYLISGKERNE